MNAAGTIPFTLIEMEMVPASAARGTPVSDALYGPDAPVNQSRPLAPPVTPGGSSRAMRVTLRRCVRRTSWSVSSLPSAAAVRQDQAPQDQTPAAR